MLILRRIPFGFDPELAPAPSTFLHSSLSSETQVPQCNGPPRQCLRAQVVPLDVQTGFSAQLRGEKGPRFFRECPAVAQGAPHLFTPLQLVHPVSQNCVLGAPMDTPCSMQSCGCSLCEAELSEGSCCSEHTGGPRATCYLCTPAWSDVTVLWPLGGH